jgi:hypothetical protein
MGYTEDVEYFSGYHFCDTLLDLASTRTAPHRTANCCSLEPCWAPIPPFFSSIRIYAFVGVCTTPYEIIIECWIPRTSDDRC